MGRPSKCKLDLSSEYYEFLFDDGNDGEDYEQLEKEWLETNAPFVIELDDIVNMKSQWLQSSNHYCSNLDKTKRQMKKWCQEYATDRYIFLSFEDQVAFRSKSDAMHFKLKWK